MKALLLVLALSAVALAGRVYSDNTDKPYTCPPDEHPRHDCPPIYEPSCSNPTYRPLPGKMGRLCFKPLCFCNEPLVREEQTLKCVPLSECPTSP